MCCRPSHALIKADQRATLPLVINDNREDFTRDVVADQSGKSHLKSCPKQTIRLFVPPPSQEHKTVVGDGTGHKPTKHNIPKTMQRNYILHFPRQLAPRSSNFVNAPLKNEDHTIDNVNSSSLKTRFNKTWNKRNRKLQYTYLWNQKSNWTPRCDLNIITHGRHQRLRLHIWTQSQGRVGLTGQNTKCDTKWAAESTSPCTCPISQSFAKRNSSLDIITTHHHAVEPLRPCTPHSCTASGGAPQVGRPSSQQGSTGKQPREEHGAGKKWTSYMKMISTVWVAPKFGSSTCKDIPLTMQVMKVWKLKENVKPSMIHVLKKTPLPCGTSDPLRKNDIEKTTPQDVIQTLSPQKGLLGHTTWETWAGDVHTQTHMHTSHERGITKTAPSKKQFSKTNVSATYNHRTIVISFLSPKNFFSNFCEPWWLQPKSNTIWIQTPRYYS